MGLIPDTNERTIMRVLPLIAALAIATPFVGGAVADERLNRDIVSPVAEPAEDCEALRESLEAQRDDNVLNAADLRELRDAGC